MKHGTWPWLLIRFYIITAVVVIIALPFIVLAAGEWWNFVYWMFGKPL